MLQNSVSALIRESDAPLPVYPNAASAAAPRSAPKRRASHHAPVKAIAAWSTTSRFRA